MATVAILLTDSEETGGVDIDVRSDSAFSLDADPSHFTPAQGAAVMLLETVKMIQAVEGMLEEAPADEAQSLVDELLEERKAEAAAE